MTTEHVSENAKRRRRTDEERLAALDAERAEILAKRGRTMKALMSSVASGLSEIAATDMDIGPIKDECRGLAARLAAWEAKK